MKKLLISFIVAIVCSMSVYSQRITPQQKENVKLQYEAFCVGMNAALPKQVDDITVLELVKFEDWILKVNYSVAIDSYEFSSEELAEMENAQKKILRDKAKALFNSGNYGMSKDKFVSLMKATKMRVIFYYYDENGVMFACVPFSYFDY